jgi:hypothetical protein
MPGDPNECRHHAANCKRLAEEATTGAREHFFSLAAQWERLASELEGARAFLDTMAGITVEKLSKRCPVLSEGSSTEGEANGTSIPRRH